LRGRIVDHPQPMRIAGLAEADEGDVHGTGGRELSLGFADRADMRRPSCTAPAREFG